MTQELCSLRPDEWVMTLWPRGTFKSTTASVGYPLWRIARDTYAPTAAKGGASRGLIVCYNETKAKGYLREIKAHLTGRNSLFAALYRGHDGGPLKQARSLWSATSITVETRAIPKKEPTLTVCGIGNVPTGWHFDYVILDDVVDPENVESDSERKSVEAAFKNVLPLLDPGGVGVVIGTRWHVKDLYGWIEERHKEIGFRVLKRAAIDKKTGQLGFPSILTQEFLSRMKRRLGDRLFACNYLNDPTASEDCPFQEINWRERKQMPDDQYEIAVLCDPSDSEHRRSDSTAIVTVAHARSSHLLFVCDVFLAPQKSEKVPQLLFDYAKNAADVWVPRFSSERGVASFRGVVCESFAFQRLIAMELHRIMLQQDKFYPVVQLPRDTKTGKDARIRGLQPRAAANGILFNAEKRSDKMYLEAVRQLREYPYHGHDDFPDALAQVNQVFSPVKGEREVKADTLGVAKTQAELNREAENEIARRDRERLCAQSETHAALSDWLTGAVTDVASEYAQDADDELQ